MSNFLITKTGRKVECNGGRNHDTICKDILHTTLDKFIRSGGVRVKIHDEQAAIECYNIPNSQQTGKVNGILRRNQIHCLVTSFKGGYDIRDSFSRPIRKI